MTQLRWTELNRYWESHSEVARELDFDTDPDGLGVVCHVGQPLWYNRYYARLQRRVYTELLQSVGTPRSGARALDVGCGAGRWCRLLDESGYLVTGVDVQRELLERNRQRMPTVEFVVSQIQNFQRRLPFDFISSVTVLQHLPVIEQRNALENLRRLAVDGAWFLALENVRDQAPHVFSHTVDEWIEAFARADFKVVKVKRYEYRAVMRLQEWVWRSMTSAREAKRDATQVQARRTGQEPAFQGNPGRAKQAAKRIGITADRLTEPILARFDLAPGPVHCGFLFRAG